MLGRVPAAAWANPEQQGWTRVKRNSRREVWRAEISGETLFLKYYREDGWVSRFKKLFRAAPCESEWNGGMFALKAGIPAARPAGFVSRIIRNRHPWALLVTEAVLRTAPLNDFWDHLQSDPDIRRRREDSAKLTEQLAEMIARAHQSGFEHLDMHAANILVQTVAPRTYRTIFIDLQSARLGVPVTDQAVVRNLAQLNQWFRRRSSIGTRLRFLRAYLRRRDEFETEFEHARPLGRQFDELVRDLIVAAGRHAERLWSQRDRRADRNGGYFCRLRLSGGWRGMAALRCKHEREESRASQLEFTRDWWCKQLKGPTRWFDDDKSQAAKNSHSAAVRRADFRCGDGTISVIIKRPLSRNWRRLLASLVTPSRSLRGWRTGNALLHRDLATASPLAVLERRRWGFTVDSMLITEALPDALDLENFIKQSAAQLSAGAWTRIKRDLIPKLATHLRRLHERGFAHRDCKASNILILRSPEMRPLWIDMDGIQHVHNVSQPQVDRALVRLHVSTIGLPGITRGDRVRFLREYLAKFGGRTGEWRSIYMNLGSSVESKLAAKAARREWKLAHYGRE